MVIWSLSLIFGKGMRPAAHGVSEAGKRAEASIRRARDVLRGRPAPPEPAPIRVAFKEDERSGQRIDDAADQQAEEELAAEEEAAARAQKKTL